MLILYFITLLNFPAPAQSQMVGIEANTFTIDMSAAHPTDPGGGTNVTCCPPKKIDIENIFNDDLMELYTSGNYSAGLTIALDDYKRSPDDNMKTHSLASMYVLTGDNASAVSIYESMLNRYNDQDTCTDPKLDALTSIASIHLLFGNYEEALDISNQTIRCKNITDEAVFNHSKIVGLHEGRVFSPNLEMGYTYSSKYFQTRSDLLSTVVEFDSGLLSEKEYLGGVSTVTCSSKWLIELLAEWQDSLTNESIIVLQPDFAYEASSIEKNISLLERYDECE